MVLHREITSGDPIMQKEKLCEGPGMGTVV